MTWWCNFGRSSLPLAAWTLLALQGKPARAQSSTNFVIAGTVLALDGTPVRNAHLTAENDLSCTKKGKDETTLADADGHFQLHVPCSGVWRLSGEAQGYPKQMYEQHGAFSTGIALSGAHPELDVVFRMAGSSSVVGTVLDEGGDPVRDAKVFLLMAGAAEGDALRTIDQTTTDDRGIYEFDDVAVGEYNVAVQVQPWYAVAAQSSRGGGFTTQFPANSNPPLDPSLDVTYPITFYPAATDAASALLVQVEAGATQQADVHLSPVPSVHVVIPSGGRTTLGFAGGGRPMPRGNSAPAIQQISEFGALRFDPTSMSVLPDGSIDVDGFAPGEYALANGRRSREEDSQQDFTVAKDAGRVISLNAATARQEPKKETTGTLSGTVMLAQKPCAGAMLLLMPVAGGDGRARRQQSNTDGSFTFENVPLGKYIVLAIDQGWSIDLKDRQALGAFLVHGMPVDLKGSMNIRTTLEAQSRSLALAAAAGS